ncbi:hypothetical protein WOLCODRAFT_85873 [Wolfiporia cocos MD-104 SS10]|uniref:DUF3533 domain-containing protein n=1 Tax=Wolfiporia cocos (strain MD-104) TaxID=742152 RepID=A0A2H3JSA7_WOLCO|nr:hypothetical protein WOLCODRAFT_85873 [Wolfiporia cocos MD-104 SS10]
MQQATVHQVFSSSSPAASTSSDDATRVSKPSDFSSRHSLFSSAIAKQRNHYLKAYYFYTALIVLLIWAILPIYWASLAYTNAHTHALKVWVVDRDMSIIGSGMLDAVRWEITHGDSAPTLGWRIVDSTSSSVDSDEAIVQSVLDERVWAVILGEWNYLYLHFLALPRRCLHTVNANATSSLLATYAGNAGGSQNITAVSIYYAEARNNYASAFYLIPYLTNFIIPTTARLSSNLTSQFVATNARDQTALQQFVRACSVSGQTGTGSSVTFEMINLRPFDAPVVTALTEVGLIVICILSFFLTIANSSLRPLLSPHLSIGSYVALRVFAPLLAYIPLSLAFATVSLPFHVPFSAKYTEAQGFFLFWIIVYVFMGAVGLATEFAIGVLTIRYAPFFLITLIITNVSTTEYPVILQPGIFHYGKGFLFYNAAQAFRTITFNTKSHLHVNIPVLVAWLLLSVITVSISTYLLDWRSRRVDQGASKEAQDS